MKKLLLFITLFTMSFSFIGCSNSEYDFRNIQLATETNDEQLITDPKSTFNDNTLIIHGQALLVNPNPNTETIIQIVWNNMINDKKSPVASSIVRTKQGGTMIFQGNRPGLSWPNGNYIIDFIVKDEIISSYEFEVIPTAIGTTSAKSSWVQDIAMAKELSVDNIPLSTTSTFSPTNEKIYFTLKTNQFFPSNSSIKIEWRYLTKSRLINTEIQTTDSNQNLKFTLDKQYNRNFLESPGNWPQGSYKADLFIDDDYIMTTFFTVS